MKHRQIAALTAFTFLALLTTGCATVTGGTTQSVSVRTQKDATDVAGANCELSNSKGNWTVTTPGTVSVHRAKDDLNIHCTKDGEGDIATAIKSSTRKGAFVAGNLLMFGLVGTAIAAPIDHATGAEYAYPETITVSFGKSDEPLVARNDASAGTTDGMPAQAARTLTTVTEPSLTK